MTALRSFVLCLLLASFGLEAHSECVRNEHGVFEDIDCAVAAYQAADREMNDKYKQLLSTLDAPSRKLLIQAQRAWLTFVDAESKFIFAVEGDGSSGHLVAMNSREKHTRERANELKNWAVR